MQEQDREYIRNLLNMYDYQDVCAIETALLIYEFTNKEMDSITDKEIDDVYNFVSKQDEVFNDYVIENIKSSLLKEEPEEEMEK